MHLLAKSMGLRLRGCLKAQIRKVVAVAAKSSYQTK
jgi:hypothetical protein